jgi:hypothetical protein
MAGVSDAEPVPFFPKTDGVSKQLPGMELKSHSPEQSQVRKKPGNIRMKHQLRLKEVTVKPAQ